MITKKLYIFIICILFALTSQVLAESKGVVKGRIIDSENGEGLPGAAVWIDELATGDISDPDGFFMIPPVRQGRYTLQASLIGYKSYIHYDLRIIAEDTLEIEIELEETILPYGEDVVVVGKKPLLNLTQPSTTRTIDRFDLELTASEEIKSVIENQLGVATLDNEIHIRGGRTYESEFLVDGVSVSDPLVRQGFALNLNPTVVDEISVISGGLSAQYGGATSGVVEVFTREGTDFLIGELKYRTDNFGFGAGFDYNTDIIDFEVSGPDPIGSRFLKNLGLAEKSYFFFSAGLAVSDTYLPYSKNLYSSFHGTSFAPRSENYWTMFFKWHTWLKNKIKLTLSYNGSVNINQDRAVLDTRFRSATYSYGFPFEYAKNLDNYNTFTQFSNQQIFRLETNPNVSTGFELTFSRFFTNLHSDVNGKSWDEYEIPVDTLPEIFEISDDSSYYIIDEGDGFYDSGDGDLWYDHFIETYSMALRFRYKLQMNQSVLAGLSYDYQTLQMTDIFKPYLGEEGLGLNYDIYKTHPSTFGLFFQNRFNFSGAIFDLGMRYDIWMPGEYAENAALSGESPVLGNQIKSIFEDETFDLFGRKARGVFSPRFGLGYLLSNNLTLFLNYNRLFKKPPPQYVYARLYTPAQGAYQLFGNPSLDFEKVTTIEAGIKYLPRPGRAISVSAYIKDINDYIAATQFIPDPRFPEEAYLVYFNLDFAKSRGVEISWVEDLSNYIRAFTDVSFSRAEGERSLPSDILRGLEARAEGELFTEVAFDWDVPWQVSLGTNISIPDDERVSLFGLGLPSGWNLNLKYFARAGKRFTPYKEEVDSFGVSNYVLDGETNSKLGPYHSWFNLSFQKYFKVSDMKLTFYFDVENLFDHKNVVMINPLTGEEYREGDVIPYGDNFFELPPQGYNLPLWENPTRYLSPRKIKMGMGIRF